MYMRLCWHSVGSWATVQKKQEPQDVCVQVMRSLARNGWPMESRSAPDPRATMRPTISWPMITGSSTFNASEPCQRWTSVPQMEHVYPCQDCSGLDRFRDWHL